jgi:hypothetical protein
MYLPTTGLTTSTIKADVTRQYRPSLFVVPKKKETAELLRQLKMNVMMVMMMMVVVSGRRRRRREKERIV